jgi:K+ transporter
VRNLRVSREARLTLGGPEARNAGDVYLGRARLLPVGPAPMMRWRKRLFGFMSWNASSATDFFGIPLTARSKSAARIEL